MASPVLRKKRIHEEEEKLPEPETRLSKKTNAAGIAAIAPPLSPSNLGRRSFQQLETAPTSFLLPGFSRPPKRIAYTESPSPGFSVSSASAFQAIKPNQPPVESEDEELVRLLRSASITPYRMQNRCPSTTPDPGVTASPLDSPIQESTQPSPPPSTASRSSHFSPIRPFPE